MQAAAAIADPVRREILQSLWVAPATAGQIADWFPISRPAVSRHLRVLRECGLVHDVLDGRRRVYTVDPGPLREVVAWIAQFDARASDNTSAPTWGQRFDALETEVARTRADRRRDAADSPDAETTTTEEIA